MPVSLAAMLFAAVPSTAIKPAKVPPVVQAGTPLRESPPVIYIPEGGSSEYRQRMDQRRQEREAKRQRDLRSRATVAVDITVGSDSLWKGTLLVGGPSGASIDRSETQALPIGCAVDDEARSMAERNSFNLRLNNPEYPEGRVNIRFNVSLQRRAATCAEAQFTRRIELSGSLQFQPGEIVTVTGDGGLVARFTLVRREVAKD